MNALHGGPTPQEIAQDFVLRFDLTEREAAVAALVVCGHTLREVAAELCIAVSTARTHLKRVFAKTGARRQAELVRLGLLGG